jgi:hypothetical protein
MTGKEYDQCTAGLVFTIIFCCNYILFIYLLLSLLFLCCSLSSLLLPSSSSSPAHRQVDPAHRAFMPNSLNYYYCYCSSPTSPYRHHTQLQACRRVFPSIITRSDDASMHATDRPSGAASIYEASNSRSSHTLTPTYTHKQTAGQPHSAHRRRYVDPALQC